MGPWVKLESSEGGGEQNPSGSGAGPRSQILMGFSKNPSQFGPKRANPSHSGIVRIWTNSDWSARNRWISDGIFEKPVALRSPLALVESDGFLKEFLGQKILQAFDGMGYLKNPSEIWATKFLDPSGFRLAKKTCMRPGTLWYLARFGSGRFAPRFLP